MKKDYFKGRKMVLATKHEKEKVMAPILERELGVKIIIPTDFNTDKFGTFTRDIERTGNQLEAARKKAVAGSKHSGLDLAISSEGSFGSHPECAWLPSNLELVLLVDIKNNIEIRGHHRSQETHVSGEYVSNIAEARETVLKWGFPKHGVIVRNSENGTKMYKGIRTFEELEKCVGKLLGRFFSKKVFIETDHRAHMNPTRMKNIKLATEDLVKNAKNLCPMCGCPGFCVIDVEKGLPCSQCRLPTDLVSLYIYGCQKCEYNQRLPRPDGLKTIEPGRCGYCNP